MTKKRGASGSEQSVTDQAEIELFKGFRAAGLDEERAMRSVQAVRVLAGHGIKETLEVHQAKVATRVDGVETELTAKIDGFESNLTAKIDSFESNLTAEIEGFRTDLKAEIATLAAEVKAIRRELTFFRWLFIILIALLTLVVANG